MFFVFVRAAVNFQISTNFFDFKGVFLLVQSSVLHETTTFVTFVKRRTNSKAYPTLPLHLRRP
ncbi:hypothetical protein A2U01_0020472 [Trifolium medium]|uniref:Uncharacterized protein n=1 Tax=Trifolium medium TaxID=97028 RepID=A0A392NK46_9FABA|nr:hypothetical protein [Trifolium medium]